MKIKYSFILGLMISATQFASAQSVKEQVEKHANDPANKDRAAKADVYLIGKPIIDTASIKKHAGTVEHNKAAIKPSVKKKKYVRQSKKTCKSKSKPHAKTQ